MLPSNQSDDAAQESVSRNSRPKRLDCTEFHSSLYILNIVDLPYTLYESLEYWNMLHYMIPLYNGVI